MITLRPFRAWRPVAEKAHLVGSRTYVSYSPEELAQRLADNPHSFLHVLRPEDADSAHLSRSERFHRVRMAFKRFCDNGTMQRDDAPAILLYEQSAHGNTSRGIIAGVSVQDYREGRIKVHEQTLTARENLFAEYLGSTGINAEPVLLTTPEGAAWEATLDPLLATRPAYDFQSNDRVRHRLWPITDERMREQLQRAFAKIPALYIADGHHRLASSARLAEASNATDVDPASWCLAFIVPRSHLYIYNFDRAITTFADRGEKDFLARAHTHRPLGKSGSTLVGTRRDRGPNRRRMACAPTSSIRCGRVGCGSPRCCTLERTRSWTRAGHQGPANGSARTLHPRHCGYGGTG